MANRLEDRLKGGEIDLNVEWERAWDEAAHEFRKTHQIDLCSGKWPSPDDVLTSIRNKRRADDEDCAKHEKARTVIRNTVTVLKTLLEIAGQAASMAIGGPASMCTNVVSFLIEAGHNYSKLFTDLTELFNETYAFLNRFKVYQRIPNLDNSLKELIRDLLTSFIQVCSISAYVLKDHKAKSLFKSLLKDSKVENEIGNLRKLAEQESKLSGALTHEQLMIVRENAKAMGEELANVSTTMLGISGVVDDLNNKATKTTKAIERVAALSEKSEQREQKDKLERLQNEKIEQLLGPKGELLDSYRINISEKLKGTGEWLKDHETYKEWTNRKSTPDNLLFILGDEDCGKTFVAYTAIQHLESVCSPDIKDTSRASVARYFFTNEANSQPVVEALKSLAWQVAVSESVYQKKLAATDKRLGDEPGIQGLWDTLFKIGSISDTVFFFIMDGFDHLSDKQQENLAQLLSDVSDLLDKKDNSTLNIRILITATLKGHNLIKSRLKKPSPVIDISECNESDIKQFIEHRVGHMTIFHGVSSPDMIGLKGDVVKGLMDLPKRNFTYLDFLLQSIDKKSVKSQITELLESAKSWKGLEESIAEEVRRSNASLTAYEKSELNEILLWVMCSKEPLTVKELDAVLYITHPEPSLQSLKTQIINKYGAFLTLENEFKEDESQKVVRGEGREDESPKGVESEGREDENPKVVLFSEYIAKYFKQLAEDRQKRVNTPENGIEKSEVQILKRFLSTVCDEDLYHRFGFDEFFNQKISDLGVNTSEIEIVEKYLSTVCNEKLYRKFGFREFFARKTWDLSTVGALNFKSGPARLARYCLVALCDPEAAAQPLHDHAGSFFQDYIKDTNLETLSSEDKAAIGSQLIKVFTDIETIQRWWKVSSFDTIYDRVYDWLLEDDKNEIVTEWFQDASVIRELDKQNQEWIRSMITRSNLDIDLMQYIAKWIAETWLHDSEESYKGLLYRVVLAFMNKVQNRKDPKTTPRIKGWMHSQYNAPGVVAQTATFARKQLGINENYKYYISLGITYEQLGNCSSALNEYEKAVDLHKEMDNWKGRLGCVRAYAGLGDHKKVVESGSTLLEDIKIGVSKPSNTEDTIFRLQMMLAESYDALDDPEKAIEIYKTVWKLKPENHMVIWGMATSYARAGNHNDLEALFKELKSHTDEGQQLDRLSIVYSTIWSRAHFMRVYAFLDKSHVLPIIQWSYNHTKEVLEAKKVSANHKDQKRWSSKLDVVNLIYGAITTRFSQDFETISQGVQLLETILDKKIYLDSTIVSEDHGLIEYSGVKELSRAYFKLVRETQENLDHCENYINRLEKLAQQVKLVRDYDDPTLLLGRCCSRLNQKERAKKHLKGFMKVAFDLLSDDDIENDWQGYLSLADCLIRIGDTENALVAWSLIGPTVKGDKSEGREGSSGSFTTEEDLTGPIRSYYCFVCLEDIKYGNDIWCCCDCPGVQFCNICYDKFSKDQIRVAFCEAKHEFLHVPPWDSEKAATVPEGQVRLSEEKTMSIEEWKAELKKAWGLS